jgi:ketosteroid isomerase-like protein
MLGHQATPPVAPPRLSDATIRAFVVEQEAAWNARDFDHYYSLCTPDAAFISLHWNADGSITREQRSAAEDRAGAQKFFASHTGKVTETDTIDSITIAPDGLSARVLGHGSIRFSTKGKPQVLNAVTDQTIILRDGHVLSLGQTDVSER